MKINTQFLPAFVSTVAIALTSTILAHPASAQTVPGTPGTVSPFPGSYQQNERSTFDPGIGGSGDLGVMDLMHRLMLGPGEFDEQTLNRNITSEADKFKQERMRLLGNPQLQLPENQENPVTNPQQ
jgi:hypothetical protein